MFENNYIDLLNFFKSVRKDYLIHNGSFELLQNTTQIIYVCRHNTQNENFLR